MHIVVVNTQETVEKTLSNAFLYQKFRIAYFVASIQITVN